MFTLRRFGPTVVTSTPRRRMRPSSGCSKPPIMRSVVVFPQPLGPRREKNSPSRMSRETSRTAATLPKLLLTPWRLMPTLSAMVERV
jgi:hypothetical protein